MTTNGGLGSDPEEGRTDGHLCNTAPRGQKDLKVINLSSYDLLVAERDILSLSLSFCLDDYMATFEIVKTCVSLLENSCLKHCLTDQIRMNFCMLRILSELLKESEAEILVSGEADTETIMEVSSASHPRKIF